MRTTGHPSPLPPRRWVITTGSPLPPDPARTGAGSPLPPDPPVLTDGGQRHRGGQGGEPARPPTPTR